MEIQLTEKQLAGLALVGIGTVILMLILIDSRIARIQRTACFIANSMEMQRITAQMPEAKKTKKSKKEVTE